MASLRRGDSGEAVREFQRLLIKLGYEVEADGIFGAATERALRAFQENHGLGVDGLAGPVTLNRMHELAGDTQNRGGAGSVDQKTLSEDDFLRASEKTGVELAAIKAVWKVESGGEGFLPDGRPKILFEGHIFWKQLIHYGIEPAPLAPGNEDILYEKWTKVHYKWGEAEYERLGRARKIHEEAALASASWGAFQIMGFNYPSCGFDSVSAFVEAQSGTAWAHLEAFCSFIESMKLLRFLVGKDWAGFARGYNGPGYADNKYDENLRKAYEKYSSS